jgi:hypothetical protein
MNYELIEMTGSNPEDSEFPKVVIEEDGEFSTAYFYNSEWYSSETQDGWFNRIIKNVVRWFEIRPTPRVPDAGDSGE